jgi:hypothetical protein
MQIKGSGFFVIVFLSALVLAFSIAYPQDLSQLSVSGKGELLSDELLDKSIRDANGQLCAGVVIISDLDGLAYSSYNGIVKTSREPGRDLLFLSPDERVVTVLKTGFAPLKLILNEIGIKLKPGGVWQVKVTGEKKSELLPVLVVTTPPEAMVIIDGVRRGTGKSHQLSPGKHTIRVEKDGFGPVEQSVQVSPTSFEFPFILKEVDVALTTINSLPPGAKLTVDGSDKGQTDRSLYLYPGTYRLRLEKADYLPIDTMIVIRDGLENRFKYSLIKNLGSLVLSVRPADATVMVNQRTVDPSKVLELPPGEYEIVASKDGYLPQSVKAVVPRGGQVAKEITLERNAGTLVLSVAPPEAHVRINREDYSKRGRIDLAPGTYRVEVSCTGYDSLSETVNIARGLTVEKKYSLRQKVGKLQFNVIPVTAGVVMTRGGVKVDEWTGAKYLKDLPEGTYEISCRLSGYKSAKQSVQIEERKSGIVEIVMKEGSDIDFSRLGIKWILVEGGPRGVFYMSATEVTFDQYDAFCNATGREKPNADFGRGKQPVINVNVADAAAFCEWMSKETGKTIRLPEEDEWEFAARGGKKSRGFEYSGSNDVGEVAWYDGNSGNKTHEVATKKPNELSLYDMSGNVWEWCGTGGVIRGGSWYYGGYRCRVSYRLGSDAGGRVIGYGFRVLQN